MANVYPDGGIISGLSSVVQLDAWNWEDAAYKTDNGVHFNMPSLLSRQRRGGFGGFGGQQNNEDPVKRGLEQIEKVKAFFREAKKPTGPKPHMKVWTWNTSSKRFVQQTAKTLHPLQHCKEMLVAVDFCKRVWFWCGDCRWCGQLADCRIFWNKTTLLLFLDQLHSLPVMADDDVDQPFKTPAMLQKAGVLFALNDDDGSSRNRNLPLMQALLCAYGLSKEEALSAITF